jgi:hypothetical protein
MAYAHDTSAEESAEESAIDSAEEESAIDSAEETDTEETDTEETDAEDEKIDTSWIANFKSEEESYNHFYKEPLPSIMLYVLYVNTHKELIHVDIHRCLLAENGWLKRDRIIALIKQYQMRESVKYKLNSILRYNIDLNPDEISAYASNAGTSNAGTDAGTSTSNAGTSTSTDDTNRFLTAEKYLDDIHFNDSITMFHDLNALYFLFSEEKVQPASVNQTKRITLAMKKHKTMRNKYKKNLKIKKEVG